MADINSKPASAASSRATPGSNSDQSEDLALVSERCLAPADDLLKFVELLFFAYRDFTGDADELLTDLGYGRAHHRVIHFVARHPGLRVADLLDILRITKQSLARVLKQLIDEGFVTQRSGDIDRRERHLYLTQKGRNFAEKLAELQCARVGKALEVVGAAGKDRVEEFLVQMISAQDRTSVAALLEKAAINEY
jgi:DNA-binding MarR family transcriptional regulator